MKAVMYKFKNSMIALIGLIFLTAVVSVVLPREGTAAPAPSTQNVNVVNTPTVNAQQSGPWSVGINGTPTVNALQNGSWSVDINGTPVVGLDAGNNTVKFDAVNNTVKIDPATPVPFRDVENPARQIYQNTRTINLGDGTAGTNIFFSPVPAGKRLVIEFVSVNGHVPSGQAWQMAQIGVTHFSTFYYDIEVKPHGPSPFAGGDQFGGSQQVRLYCDAGETPSFFAQRSASAGEASIVMNISGYFVDVP
jgi:hypothetical protein